MTPCTTASRGLSCAYLAMTTKALPFIALMLLACGAPSDLNGCTIPDAGVDPDPYADAGEPPMLDDGGVLEADAAGEEDAGELPPYACDPFRTPGVISHNDCRRYPDRPICDAISERCVPPPAALCGACETDEQCRDVDLRARCVYKPGESDGRGSDSVCLVPCDEGCGWVGDAYEWSANAQCFTFPSGEFCSPDWGGRTHCRNPDGTRQPRSER